MRVSGEGAPRIGFHTVLVALMGVWMEPLLHRTNIPMSTGLMRMAFPENRILGGQMERCHGGWTGRLDG